MRAGLCIANYEIVTRITVRKSVMRVRLPPMLTDWLTASAQPRGGPGRYQ